MTATGLDRRHQLLLVPYLVVEDRERPRHLHEAVGIAAAGSRQVEAAGQLGGQFALLGTHPAVVNLNRVHEPPAIAFYQALQSNIAFLIQQDCRKQVLKRMGENHHAARLIDSGPQLLDGGEPRPALRPGEAKDEHMAAVRIHLHTPQDGEAVTPPQHLDLLRVPDLIVVSDRDTVQSPAAGLFDEVGRVDMAVSRTPAGVVVEVDEHARGAQAGLMLN